MEDSWVRDQWQDGDVHKIRGTSDRPTRNQRREGVNSHRAANIARVAGDTKGHCRGPTRQHDKPGPASRPVLEGVVESGEEEDSEVG